jgi:hypothetical protein
MPNEHLACRTGKLTKKHDKFCLPHSPNGNQFWVTSNTPNVHDLFGVNNNKKKRHNASELKNLYSRQH